MGRIRTIKPEFWTDPFMVQLPPFGRLMFIALITSADDHGFIKDEPERIALEVMPREPSLDVDDWIQLFESAGKIDRFITDEGDMYLQIKNWAKHQRVDKPTKSRISREGSRKLAIPISTRRDVAEKYGCPPGESVEANCYYCGVQGRIHWHSLYDGRPSSWVTFPGLELDHLEPEHEGGGNGSENIVLACRSCNRGKGTKNWVEAICKVNSARISKNPPEDSCTEGKGKERKGSNNDGAADAYPFEGETIRLNQKHYDELFHKYPNLDIHYQLDQLDSELRGKKNWYVEMHSKLNYRNRTPAHQKQQTESRGLEV